MGPGLVLGLVLLAARAEPWTPEGISPPPPGGAPVVGGTSTRRFCFPSGLTVHGERARTDGVVLVGTVFGAGSAAEEPGKEGLAHLVEHLWFRSDHAGPGGVWAHERAEGRWLNAQTSRDQTAYLVGGRAEQLEELLAREAARLADPLRGVGPAQLEVERGVVDNERRRGFEQAGRVGLDRLLATLYPPGHPYAHPVIGSAASLAGITLDDARAYVAAHYRPANASVHVSGEVVLGALPALVQASFPAALLAAEPGASTAPVPCGTPTPPPPASVPDPVDTGIQVLRADVDAPYALAAWALPEGFTAEAAMGRSVAEMVEFSIWEALDRDVNCWFWDQVHGSALICALDLEGSLSKRGTAQAMVRAGSRVWKAAGWDWSRTYQNLRWVLAADFLAQGDLRWTAWSGLSFDQMSWSHATGQSDYAGKLFGLITTPTMSQAKGYTDRWIRPERAVALVVEPHQRSLDEADGEPAAQEQAEASLPVPVAVDVPWVEVAPPTAAELAGLAAVPSAETLQRSTLANGMQVAVLPSGAGSQVRVEVLLPFPAGTADQLDVARASINRLSTFEGELHGRPFERAHWYVGGEWVRSLGDGVLVIGVTGSTTHLDTLVYLVRRRLEQAAVSTGGTGRLASAYREQARQRDGRPEVQADRLRWAALLGDRPATWDLTLESAQAMAGMSTRRIRAWLYALLQPQHATLVISGAVSPVRAQEAAVTWLGDWRPEVAEGLVAGQPAELPPLPDRQVVVVDQPRTSQHRVELSCRLAAPEGMTAPAHEVAARWLDDHLFRQVRSTRGLTYSPSAGVDQVGDAVVLRASILADGRASGLVVRELLQGVEQLAAGLEPAEVHTVQRALAAGRRQRFRSATDLATVLTDEVEGRPGWLDHQAWPARLAAVDAAAVSAAMADCFDHEVITITGPSAAVEEQLAAGGLSFVQGR